MGEAVLYHEPDGTRCLDIGGSGGPGYAAVTAKGRAEMAGDDIRLTYVALTRAQSQVVAWWAPSWDEVNGGLSRLLRGRVLGQAEVPDSLPPKVDDAAVAGASAASGRRPAVRASSAPSRPPTRPSRRRPRRPRTSAYAASTGPSTSTGAVRPTPRLIRAAEEAGGVTSEPELSARDDELADELADEADGRARAAAGRRAALPSPMADLPSGAAFGSLVHGVLEEADPFAADLEAELLRARRGAARSGGRSTPPADELAPRWCRCTTPRSARWPAG